VTVIEAWQGGLAWRDVPGFVAAQIAGAFAGVASAHVMFAERLFSVSDRARAGGAQVFGEFVATFGLLAIIRGCARHRPDAVAFAVGAYITAAYWFTSSTSFANQRSRWHAPSPIRLPASGPSTHRGLSRLSVSARSLGHGCSSG
jgi:glycerol uptake facilitator-like aquaporin